MRQYVIYLGVLCVWCELPMDIEGEFITQCFAILKVLGAFDHQFYWSGFVMIIIIY